MRSPVRLQVSRKSGLVMMSDMIPGASPSPSLFFTSDDGDVGFTQNKPLLEHPVEHVPWRMTPSMQHFIERVAFEGVFTTGIVAFARVLTEPEVRPAYPRTFPSLTLRAVQHRARVAVVDVGRCGAVVPRAWRAEHHPLKCCSRKCARWCT